MTSRAVVVAAVASLVGVGCGGAKGAPAGPASAAVPAAQPPASPAGSSGVAPKPPPKPGPCAGHTAFDFWVGLWEVKNPKGDLVGHNSITRAERGCVLVENWRSAKGGTGTSLNYVDPVSKEWVQLWVDAGGGVIKLRGGLSGKAMVLSGDYVTGKGVKSQLRGTWTPNDDGSVRQHFEESKDGGTSWATWFDGTYRRVDKTPSP